MRHHHRPPEDIARMLMTREPATVASDDTLMDAAARMATATCAICPSWTANRHVVGILSDRDVRTLSATGSRPLVPATPWCARVRCASATP
jgi:CBS domain-containing protein